MLRDRLIFSLIYNSGTFMQSRNFRLQRVGDIGWLERNYKFQKISFSIDELIIVDATRNNKNIRNFSKTVQRLVNDVFIPVAAGGGIRSIEDAELLFNSGADKVILNSALFKQPELAKMIIEKYGSQCLIASVDYKLVNNEHIIYIQDGTLPIKYKLKNYLKYLEEIGVGEILLNSIDKDGTGFGYDIKLINECSKDIKVPLIIMGGAGNAKHLADGLLLDGVSAVATANLFNFIGDGLPKARETLINDKFNLAKWTKENKSIKYL